MKEQCHLCTKVLPPPCGGCARSVPACTCRGPGLTSWSPEVAYGPSLQTTCHSVRYDEDCDESFKAILHHALGLRFGHGTENAIEKEPNASRIGYITLAFACVLLALCLRFACVLLALGCVLLALGENAR